VPLWVFRYFPSQDGPAHLGNASILREYYTPARTAFRAYYVLNQTFTPNWAGHLALTGLMAVFPPLVAEKVFLSGYVILLATAIRYALTALRQDAAFLVLLGFPFIYNYTLHMGFYSFAYSLVLFFLVTGYWLKHRERFGARETVTLAALSLLLFFSHIVSMVAAVIAIVLLTGWRLLIDLASPARRWRITGELSKMVPVFGPLCALAPACLLAGLFLIWNRQTHLSWADIPAFNTVLKDLVSLRSLVSYDGREVWAARGLATLFVTITVYLLVSGRARPRPTFGNGFMLLAVAYAVLFVAGPSSVSNGSYIYERMNLYPSFALILWFATHPYGPLARRWIQAVALGLVGLFLGLHTAKYRELNDYLTEFVSVSSSISANTTVLPIAFSHSGDVSNGRPLSQRIDVFLNAAGYIAAERHIVDLANYQASQTPFFPILFRPDLNPAERLQYAPVDSGAGELTAVPTDILGYPRRTGGGIDYVLVWGVRSAHHHRPIPRLIFSQLSQGYDLVYTSAPRGLARLYRRKDLFVTPEPAARLGRHPGW
jgi:hypothetical protein